MPRSIDEFLKADDPETTPATESPMDSWYSGAEETSRLQISVKEGAKKTPDTAALITQLKNRTQLAEDVVERNLPAVQESYQASQFDPAKFRESTPITADWMAESPNNSGMVKDEIDAVSNIEKTVQDYSLMRTMYNALQVGAANFDVTLAQVPALAYNLAALPQNLAVKAIGRPDLQVQSPEWLTNNPVAKYYQKQADIYKTPEMDASIIGEIGKGNYAKAGRVLAAQVVANSPQQAMIIAGTLAGYGIPALAAAGVTTAAQVSARNQEAGADPTASAIDAIAQGTIEAAFERIGTFGILKKWEGVIAKSYGKQASKEVLADFAKTMLYSFAGEANEEFLTQIAQDFADYATGVNPDAMKGTFTRAIDAGLIGGFSGATMTAPSAITSGVAYARGAKLRDATLAKDFYLSLGKTVEATKLMEISPESIGALIDKGTNGTPVGTAYVATEALEAYFQSKGVDPVKAMQDLGFLDAYTEAKQSNTDVEIPLSKWVEKTVGTEFFQGLADDIKLDPEKASINEIKLDKAKEAEAIDKVEEQAKITEQEKAAEEAGAKIRENVVGQLKAIGMDEKTAETNAKIMVEGFKKLGERAGIDPFELFSKYSPTFQKADEPIENKQDIVYTDTGLKGKFKQTSHQDFIAARDKSANLAFLTPYTAEEMKDWNLYLSDDGVGFALTPAKDMVGVFNNSARPGAWQEAVTLAIAEGAKTCDCVTGYLENYYNNFGFVVDKTEKWSDEFAPKGWNYEKYGRPDIAFLRFPESLSREPGAIAERVRIARAEKLQRNSKPGTSGDVGGVHTSDRLIDWEARGGLGEAKPGQAGGRTTTPEGLSTTFEQVGPDPGGRSGGGKDRQDTGGGQVRQTTQSPALEGLPQSSPGPSQGIRDIARTYAERAGIKFREPAEYVKVDPARGARIAAEFESLKHDPENPETKAAYRALIDETVAQYQVVKTLGLKIEAIPPGENPYPGGPTEVHADIKKGHLWFFPTDQGFGSGDIQNNPLLESTNETIDGKTLLANDVFRIVHDIFGHAKEGFSFGPHGDENAWQSHARMYSPLAFKAMTTETRGQNSWVNYGPKGAENQANKANTTFAEQKIGILPEWVMTEGLGPDKPETLFQGDDVKRASIRFGADRKFFIDLFKSADLTSLLHEKGHLFLEVMADLAELPETNQELKDDWSKILKYLGAKSRQEITKAHHEMFAKSFEAYLMEGKAPSAELRPVFARIKVWMLSVYATVKKLNVELTPEIRGVFDRLLASQEEIAAVQREQNIQPLFFNPSKFGMTRDKAEQYAAAVARAQMAAEDALSNKLMAEFKRERESWWKDQRASIKETIAADVDKQRVYAAIDHIKKEMKIQVPEEFKDKMPKGIASKKGINPAIAAEFLGFESADDMLTQFANAPDRKVLVERLTSERMEQLYPSLKDAALRDEAIKVVHNEKRAEVLRFELQHLASHDIGLLKEVIKRVVRRVPSEAAVREQARKLIGARVVRDIRPYKFQLAEIKAAKTAGEMLAKGDLEGAFEAKRLELLNHEIYREAIKAREEIESGIESFRKISRPDEKLAKTRDMDLVNAARAILSTFGIGKADKTALDYISPIERYDPDTYETVKALIQSAASQGGDYMNVSYDDFVAMKDTVAALWDLSRRNRQIEIDGKIMDREEVKEELTNRISELVKPGARAGYDKMLTTFDRTKLYLLGINSALRRVESWVDAMDGGDPKGVFRKYVWNPISDGTTKYRTEKKVYLEKFLKIVKDVEPSLTRNEIYSQELNYRFAGKAELLGAILHTGNDSNLSKLLRGRGWGTTDQEGNLDRSRWDKFIKRMQDQGVLTEADYDFVQNVWDLLEELKPKAQIAHKEMYGHYFNEVVANEFQTQFGTYRGGYVPAVADPFLAEDADIRNQKESLENNNNSFMFPTSGRGFTKSRVEQYAAPLAIDLRYITSHIDKVLRFVNIETHVKDVARIVMDKGFRAVLTDLDQTAGGDMLVPWLQRAAQQRIQTPGLGWGGRGADAFFKGLRNRTGLQVMVGNVVNALQQPTGLFIGAVKVKPKYLRNALWGYVRHPKQMAEDIAEKSEFMRNRETAKVIEIQNTIEELILNPTKYEKAREFAKKHGYFLQSATQNVVDTIVWSGAYDMAVGQGDTEKQAVRQADSAVRLTQGSFAAEDVSRFETGTPFVRAFKMFYSYFNMQANLMQSEFTTVARGMGLKKGAGRLLYVYALGFMIPAVLGEVMVRAASGDDWDKDDDGYLNDIMGIFFSSQFRGATAMFPLVGPTVSAGFNAFNDKWYDDRISTSPAIAMIESAVKTPYDIYKTILGEGNTKRTIRDTLTLIGLLTGLPLVPFAKPIGYLADVSEGNAEPTGPIDFARGLVTGKSGGK